MTDTIRNTPNGIVERDLLTAMDKLLEERKVGTGTYDPEDNKLRLYPFARLDPETYAKVRAAGFIWAPRQELFVAPMWTPARADLLTELAGEIGDEDTSLTDRAADRAERFAEYGESRKADAEQARKAVSAIADNIPLGQPILVGHHSEKRARRDAEKIQNGMARAVKMWETAQYWKMRAAGAISAASYKQRPRVRARRIKGLEADQRKYQRDRKQATTMLYLWENIDRLSKIGSRDGQPVTLRERALALANEGGHGLWSELNDGKITSEQARLRAKAGYAATVAWCDRWLAHISFRLTYERAMLEADGGMELLAKPKRAKLLPLLNYRAAGGVLTAANPWDSTKSMTLPQVDMTADEYAKINGDYKATRVVGNSHRVRTAMQRSALVSVFITDAKTHERPADVERAEPMPRRRPMPLEMVREQPSDDGAPFKQMAEQLKAGVQVVTAPDLFPTPPAIAKQAVELAEIEPGHLVLEPSVGTGNLVRAIDATVDTEIVGYEINQRLVDLADRTFPSYRLQTRCRDFLDVTEGQGGFDRVVMNPPFANGADIKHIQHALTFLKPGGKLVAICANGPRQRAALEPLADLWRDLPDGSFADAGTNVRTALILITKGAE